MPSSANETAIRLMLVGNYRADRNLSMLGFESCLASHLPALGVQVQSVYPRPVFGGKARSASANKWLGYIDKFLLFPRTLRRASKEADLVHICDQGDALWVRAVRNRKHLITCHDVLSIRAARGDIREWTVGRTGRILQKEILDSLRLAANVACVTETTKRELDALIGPRKGTRVVLNGLYRDIRPMSREGALDTLHGVLEHPQLPFVFHVGGNQPYKNRVGLLRIYRELSRELGDECPRLVMAGHRPSPEIEEEAKDLVEQGRVQVLVLPSDEQVTALYCLAQGLVFPSLFEGFGVPIIEAQTCGCPVFTSNRAPMNEIGGSFTTYFDPQDPKAAAREIATAWSGRWETAQRAQSESARWSPGAMAQRYVEVYRQVL